MFWLFIVLAIAACLVAGLIALLSPLWIVIAFVGAPMLIGFVVFFAWLAYAQPTSGEG